MLQAMAGHDPADPASADHLVPDYRAALQRDVSGLCLGLVRHFYERDNEANAATCDAIAAAARTLEGLGCSVCEVTLSPLAGLITGADYVQALRRRRERSTSLTGRWPISIW